MDLQPPPLHPQAPVPLGGGGGVLCGIPDERPRRPLPGSPVSQRVRSQHEKASSCHAPSTS
eukprot:8285476-Pyramimonas_sp.AAC.1